MAVTFAFTSATSSWHCGLSLCSVAWLSSRIAARSLRAGANPFRESRFIMEHARISLYRKEKAKLIARKKRRHKRNTVRKGVRSFQFGIHLTHRNVSVWNMICLSEAISMSKNRKRNRSGELASTHRCHENYLIRSLGTPDGLRALGELVRNTAAAFSLFLITTFILFNKHSFAGTMLRITGALALNRALVGVELLAKPIKQRRSR
jgi:hypothetical protein